MEEEAISAFSPKFHIKFTTQKLIPIPISHHNKQTKIDSVRNWNNIFPF